jgi:plastocyanin domain-containing protein
MSLRILTALVLFASVSIVSADTKPSPKPPRVDIRITPKGFEPESINVPARTPVTLVFVRTTEKTCTKSVVVSIDETKTIERELPLDKPVEIVATFPKAGKLGYTCSMKMNKGTIIVQ